MGWASRYIEKLRAGETVSFRPHGHSMTGRIESGQLCTVVPTGPAMLEVGDIVLCKVAGNECLALRWDASSHGSRTMCRGERSSYKLLGIGPAQSLAGSALRRIRLFLGSSSESLLSVVFHATQSRRALRGEKFFLPSIGQRERLRVLCIEKRLYYQ